MKRTQRLIALLVAILMLVSTLMVSLSSCADDGDSGDGSGGGTSDGSGNQGTGGSGDSGNQGTGGSGTGGSGTTPEMSTYTVKLETVGGMPIAGTTVYIYGFKDGTADMTDFKDYCVTNAEGVATVSLDKTGSYAAVVDPGKGYNAESHYPLVGATTSIKISTSLVTDTKVAGKTLKLGDIMYDFAFTTTDGKTKTLKSYFDEGKEMVLLNFWFTTCDYCITEFPYMETVYGAYKDKVAIVALDQQDSAEEIKTFKDSFYSTYDVKLTFDMAKDNEGVTSAFGITGFPTSVVIDKYGTVALIESGALPSERAFRIIFDHFSAEDYKQQVVKSLADITPKIKPNVQMPSEDDMYAAFVKDAGTASATIDRNKISFANDPDDEYSWPFIITLKHGAGCDGVDCDGTACGAEKCIVSTNVNYEDSYTQLFMNVTLEAGDVVAFDYFSSTERGADIMYVLVDKKDIYSISGETDSGTFETCYAYVAKEAGEYEISVIYIKDDSDNVGEDRVYLKDLRICDIEDIDSDTFIYRFAAENENAIGQYTEFPELVKSEVDGYYHVGTAEGPILLANLMGYTRFSGETTAYYIAIDKSYAAEFINYCNYASNASVNGCCPVNEELMQLLKRVARDGDKEYENAWLEFCCYYEAYYDRDDDGIPEQLEDPIKGLAPFSAYDAILSENGTVTDPEDFPNSVYYNRVIMPRGLLYRFRPTESGTYKITSYSMGGGTNGWIFVNRDLETRESTWLTYSNVYRPSEVNPEDENCYMIAYLEAGVDYYIDIAFYDVYEVGEIKFKLEKIGDEGYHRFTLASPGYFTYIETESGGNNGIIAGGIEVEKGADGYYREKRSDGKVGSFLYADFTYSTLIFDKSISKMIELEGFNFGKTEGDLYIEYLRSTPAAKLYYLELYLKTLWVEDFDEKYDEYNVDDVVFGVYSGEKGPDGKPTKTAKDEQVLSWLEAAFEDATYNNDTNFVAFLRELWGAEYEEYDATYKVNEVLQGIYHGTGADLTSAISVYLDKVITVGYNEILDETIEEGDVRIGTVIVDEDLAELLTKLMDKYTFEGVENSWTKVCYYTQYFCAETPN